MRLNLDFAEVSTNMVIGLFVNGLISMVLFDIGATQAAGGTVVFLVASFCRHWLLRKLFRALSELEQELNYE